MAPLSDLFSRIEQSSIAMTVRDSTILTGSLSGLHLIGLTLIVGSALVSFAALSGFLVNDQPIAELTRATRRGTMIGLAISIATGALLVSFRVAMSASSRAFQIKMSLLAAAAIFHFFVYIPAARGQRSIVPPRLAGAISFVLWLGVVLAGCAFILFE
jgi:hypothetical protein